jgi:hypothetical protein
MKKEREKSDPSIVAKRPANKPETAEADLWGGWVEPVEPREGTEGNTGEQHTCRTPSRASVSQGLERVRDSPSNTQGGSPVRESRTPGSVRGVLSNEHPYRDRRTF